MLFFTVASCASSSKEEQVPNDLSDTTAEQQVNSNNDSMPKPEPVPPPPSPGSARVKGEVIAVDTSENGQNLIIHFKIHQTLAYSSSTPSIAPQDTLQLSASRKYRNVQQNDTLTAEIRYREPLAISGDSVLQWFLVNVEQNTNQK